MKKHTIIFIKKDLNLEYINLHLKPRRMKLLRLKPIGYILEEERGFASSAINSVKQLLKRFKL